MKLKILTKKEKLDLYKELAMFCEKRGYKYLKIEQPKSYGGSIEVKVQIPDIYPIKSV